jgi:hypothetical protein
MKEIRTQDEADNIGDEIDIRVFANVTLKFYDSSQPHVVCYDSSQPCVVCYGSSQPRVACSGSSQPRVECYDSSQPRVACYDSSQPRVACYGYTQVAVAGERNLKITATAEVRIRIDRGDPDISGGIVHRVMPPKTPAQWCELNGAMVIDGVATLFKAVHGDFRSSHDFPYNPETVPVAPDWDGGKKECGGGLHFCARPLIAKSFDASATRFMACPVALADMAVAEDPEYPSKIKAKGCCGPVLECDDDGIILQTQTKGS